MADANSKAEGSETDEDGVHRLRDIVVEEVSLVDRPANQRRFLVVKRNDASDNETGKGRAIDKAKKKTGPEDEGEDDEEEDKNKKKAAKKPFGSSRDDEDDEGDEEDAEKARGNSNGEEDEDEDEEDDKAKPPWKRKQQRNKTALAIAAPAKLAVLGTMTKALERLMALAKRVQSATEPDDGAASGVPEAVGAELGAIAELLSTEQRKNAPSEVAKAGARMAKDRLAKFQQALTLLADILTELTGAQAGEAKQKAAVSKRDPASQQAIEIPGMADLVAGIGELTSIVKRQEEELERVRKARTTSNAIPVEGNRRVEADVSWPLDMNRPISRDKVRKDRSFFDE